MFAEAYRPVKARQRRAILITTLLAAAWLLALSVGRLLPLPGTEALLRSGGPGPLALAFEPNAGQADPAARFLAHTKGSTLFFTPAGVVLALTQAAAPGATKPDSAAAVGKPGHPGGDTPAPRLVSLRFLDANPATALTAAHTLPGTVSYFHGNDPGAWQTALPTYADLTYADLYPGISLAYSGAAGQLKGTYTLAPGADPTRIRWRYAACGMSTADCPSAVLVAADPDGNLQITSTESNADSAIQNPKSKIQITEKAPVAWQEREGQRTAVPIRYTVGADGSVGFLVAAYDPTRPLTIDPTLTYATYLGGFYSDGAGHIALDSAGYIYVTGSTSSTDFPITNAYQPVEGGQSDAFVTKLSPDGSTLIYSTFLGGDGEIDGGDFGDFISVDTAGNVIVAGSTDADDFPTTPGAYQTTYAGTEDVFIAKLNAAGSALIFGTYVGDGGVDEPYGFAVDPAGNTYFTGYWYPGFSSWAFVGELSADGSQLVFYQSLGGNVPGPGDQNANSSGEGITLDAAGNIYVTGYTRAADFPITPGAYRTSIEAYEDGFITKLNATTHTIVYSTYIPGGVSDYPAEIAVDGAGNAYITGNTSSSDFPITAGAFQPTYGDPRIGFATKLNAAGSALVYSTFIGGPLFDFDPETYGFGIAVNSAGNAYVVGYTSSSSFPVVNPLQPTLRGLADAFITKLNPTGTGADYSTYLGGTGTEAAAGVALDGQGNAYVVGFTSSTDFPTVAPVQGTNHGNGDAFIVRIADTLLSPTPTRTGTPPTATPTRTPECGGVTAWRTEVPMPIAHAESAAAVLDNRLYVIRGASNSPTPVPYTQRFDPVANAWATAAPMPNTLAFDQAAATGGRVYAIGHIYSESQSFLQVYDPATDTWTRGATLPEELLSGAMVVYENKIYIFGGYVPTQPGSNHVYEYDPAGNAFTPKAPMPTGQSQIGAAVVGNRIYVVGGYQYIHYAYDPAANTWTTIATPLTPSFAVPGVFGFNGELWVVGGYDNATRRGYPPGQEVQIYNPLSNSWRYGPAFQTPRYWSTAVGVLGDRAYVVGGIDLNSETYPYVYLNQMESITDTSCPTTTATPPGTPAPHTPTATPTHPPATLTPAGPTVTPGGATRTPAPATRTVGATRTTSATPPGPTHTPGASPTVCALAFSDVPPTHPFYAYVHCAACRGVVSGYADGTYRPGANVTRGQIAKMIANSAAFGEAVPAGRQSFADVPSTQPFWLWIERLYAHGAINGYDCGGSGEPCDAQQRPYFRPNTNVTRGQLAKIDAIARGYTGTPEGQVFADVPPTHPFYLWTAQVASAGVISGYTCGGPGEPCDDQGRPYFRAYNTATRGQTAKIVVNTFFPACANP